MQKTITIDETTIHYNMTVKNVKNINLRIKPDGSISVSADEHVSQETINKFLLAKSQIILKTLNSYAANELPVPSAKKFVSGESFNLLGRELRLKVVVKNVNDVTSDGVYIILNVWNPHNFAMKQQLVTDWYSEQRKNIFDEIIKKTYNIFSKYGIQYPDVQIRDMKTRWGSCNPKTNKILLNPKLIETPKNCIEYVIMHEFCHLLHNNHSKMFYLFLTTLMPDWKERKKILNSFLLNFSE